MTPTPNADELLELAPVSGEQPCDPLPPSSLCTKSKAGFRLLASSNRPNSPPGMLTYDSLVTCYI